MVVVIAADQVTKWWALTYLTPGDSVEILGRFFMFTLVFNEGGAMGTNIGSSAYYMISSLLILLFVLYYMYTNRDNKLVTIPLALISGGAVGNIIDRARLGSVVDFLDVDFFDIDMFGFQLQRWWTFNIADAAISCAIVFLLIVIFFLDRRRRTAQPVSENSVQQTSGS